MAKFFGFMLLSISAFANFEFDKFEVRRLSQELKFDVRYLERAVRDYQNSSDSYERRFYFDLQSFSRQAQNFEQNISRNFDQLDQAMFNQYVEPLNTYFQRLDRSFDRVPSPSREVLRTFETIHFSMREIMRYRSNFRPD